MGALTDNWRNVFHSIETHIGKLEAQLRAVSSSDTGFPVRENLLPEALLVFPAETPILNRLSRLDGSGTACSWRELTGFSTTGSVFYAEAGSPGASTSDYVSRSASYKLMGREFGVTGFAYAAGANYQDQLATERRNTIISVKMDIESAIINADGTGDAFEGLITQITAGNSAHVESIAGNLVLDDIGDALVECHDAGYQVDYILVNAIEAQTINKLVLDGGSHSITVIQAEQGKTAGQMRVSHFIDPVTGVAIEIIPHRNLAQGTVLGIPEKLPVPVPGRQGQMGIWWDELLPFTEMEVGVSADSMTYYLKTYATMPFPARRGAFKLTDISAPA